MSAVELLTIGDELLLGETLDGNGAWLGGRLAAWGVRVARRVTVGDDEDAIAAELAAALDRTGAVICTGGLGPTRDDRTRTAAARVFRAALEIDAATLAALERRFAARGLAMPTSNRTQAEVPAGARIFANARGTAPGLALEDDAGRWALLLPGVPHEMRGLMDGEAGDHVRARAAGADPVLHRRVRTWGVPESLLADRLAGLATAFPPLELAFLPGYHGVDLRWSCWGRLPAAAAERLLDEAAAAVAARLGAAVYNVGDEGLETVVAGLLLRRGATLALAESCTGGLLAKRLTDVPGASGFLVAGFVAYADDAKHRLLGVPRATLAAHGAVSGETAAALVRGALAATGAGAAAAITGIAGPGGGTPEKPVGTVWIAAALAAPAAAPAVTVRHHLFTGDRQEVRERSAQAALALLRELLEGEA
jgi:nicotinamide-nucleotide amidase